MTDVDTIDSQYIDVAVAVFLGGMMLSLVILTLFGDFKVSKLWYGLDMIGIAPELLMIPVLLSGIGFIYFFVYSLYLIKERDEHMIIALEFMYLGTNLWAFFLYSTIKISNVFKVPTIISLWMITITSSIILYRIVDIGDAGSPYQLIGIILGVCVIGQSIIDSVFWSLLFYLNQK